MIFFCFLWWNVRNTLPQNRRWVSLCCSFLFVEVNCFSICAPGRFRRQNHLVRVRETSRFGLKYYFCSPQTRLEFSPALVFGLVWFWSTHIREEYLLVLAPNMAGKCPEVSQKTSRFCRPSDKMLWCLMSRFQMPSYGTVCTNVNIVHSLCHEQTWTYLRLVETTANTASWRWGCWFRYAHGHRCTYTHMCSVHTHRPWQLDR